MVCHALDLPAEALSGPGPDEARLARAPREAADADALYRQRVKGVYADLLAFMGRVEAPMDEEHQRYWTAAQMAAMQAVEAVKGAKHLQKNMLARLAGPPSPQREAYLALRRHLFAQMRALHALDREPLDNGARVQRLQAMEEDADRFEAQFRAQVLALLREGHRRPAGRFAAQRPGLRGPDRAGLRAPAATEEPGSLRELRRLSRQEDTVG